jgi:adenylate cyclase
MALLEAGGFAIDWDRGQVTDAAGGRTVLRAQSLAVLKTLHERSGSLVSKDELIEKIWPGIAVTDDSLVQCIAELRRALKDDDHKIIKTLPKRGYIFDAPKSAPQPEASAAPYFVSVLETLKRGARANDIKVHERSIAILPFANLSSDAEQDYFVDGLSEDIIMGLSNMPGLFVTPRNSAFAYKGKTTDAEQVADDLGVTYVLEGSVRRAGDRLRINAQLINGREGGLQVWAERVDHQVKDVFASQDEIATKLSEKILDTLQVEGRTPVFKTRNRDAYKLCARTRDIWQISQSHCALAQQNYETVLGIEPGNVEATFQLGIVHSCAWYHWSQPGEDHRLKAKLLTSRALEMAKRASIVHTAAAWVHLADGSVDLAAKLIETALNLNPNNSYAYGVLMDVQMLQGNVEAALDAGAMTYRIDPHAPGWCAWMLGAVFYHAGRYEDAVTTFKRPETYNSGSKSMLAAALAMLGRKDEAQQEAKLYMTLNPDWRTSRDAIKRPYQIAEHRQRFMEGFRMAGLPE